MKKKNGAQIFAYAQVFHCMAIGDQTDGRTDGRTERQTKKQKDKIVEI